MTVHIDLQTLDLSMDKVLQDYPDEYFPQILHPRTGKANKTYLEQLNLDLYKTDARMVAFHINRERIHDWIKSLLCLYYDHLGQSTEYIINWHDEPSVWEPYTELNRDIPYSIVIDVHKISQNQDCNTKTLLYKITFFVKTGTIQAQGNNKDLFVNKHFPILKSIVSKITEEKQSPSLRVSDITDDTTPKQLAGLGIDRLDEECVTDINDETLTEKPVINQQKHKNTQKDKLPRSKLPVPKNDENLQSHFKTVQDNENLIANLNIVSTLQKLETEFCNMKNLSDDMNKVKDVCNSLENKFQEMYYDLKHIKDTQTKEQHCLQLQNHHTKLEQTINELGTKNNDLQEKYNYLEHAYQRQQLQYNQLESEKIEKEQHYLQLQNHCAMLEQTLTQLRRQNCDLQEKCNNLEGQQSQLPALNFQDQEKETTGNSYSPVRKETPNKPDINRRTQPVITSRHDLDQQRNDTPIKNQNKPKTATILFDSHGNGVNSKKMYRDEKVKAVVLEKKNIQGAKEYINNNYKNIPKHEEIIIAVGSNDLHHKEVDTVIEDIESLVNLLNLKLPDNPVSVLPAFIRLGQRDFNRKVRKYNCKLLDLEQHCKINIIENTDKYISECQEHQHLFAQDGIHFSKSGTVALVKIIKTYLNEKFGMTPYSQYSDRNEDHYRASSGRSGGQRQWQRQRVPNGHQRIIRASQNRDRVNVNFDLKSALSDIINQL